MKKLGTLVHVKRIVRCNDCSNWFEIEEAKDLERVPNRNTGVHLYFHCPVCGKVNEYAYMKKDTMLIFEEGEDV